MKLATQYCKICNKMIVTKYVVKSCNQSKTRIVTSDFGVLFNNVWFCNECWHKIIHFKK
jgi:hypothetical protein